MFRILLGLSLVCGVWSNPYIVVFSENSNYNTSSTTQGNTFDLAFSIDGVNDSFDLQLSKNPISVVHPNATCFVYSGDTVSQTSLEITSYSYAGDDLYAHATLAGDELYALIWRDDE